MFLTIIVPSFPYLSHSSISKHRMVVSFIQSRSLKTFVPPKSDILGEILSYDDDATNLTLDKVHGVSKNIRATISQNARQLNCKAIARQMRDNFEAICFWKKCVLSKTKLGITPTHFEQIWHLIVKRQTLGFAHLEPCSRLTRNSPNSREFQP